MSLTRWNVAAVVGLQRRSSLSGIAVAATRAAAAAKSHTLPRARAAFSQSGRGAIAARAQRMAAALQTSQRPTIAPNGIMAGVAGKSCELSQARQPINARCAAIQAGRRYVIWGAELNDFHSSARLNADTV